MDNIMTIVKKELFRFFHDKRVLMSTVLLPGLMIYFMYSFMGQAFSSASKVDDDYQTTMYVTNMPDSLKPAFDSMNVTYEDSSVSLEDMKKSVEDKKTDIVVTFPANFEKDVMAYDKLTATKEAPQVEVFYNSSRTESAKAYSMVTSILSQYEGSMINKFDVNGLEDGKFDLASDKDSTGQLFASLFPMLLMMFIFSACMAVAPEAIAGEKERGTLTTILVTPIKRSQLAIGKIISLSIMAILGGLSSFIGTALSLPKLVSADEMGGISANVYGVTDYVILLLVMLSSVLVIISVISIISAMAKSIKEAGTMITPLMLIVMVISITTMFGDGAKLEAYWYAIPIYNSVQSMVSVFTFSSDMVNVALTVGSNVIVSGIMVYILTRMFNSEKVMFSK